ncbi:single-stranded-DNA-specific exonuclease RecJ [uncultured Campylobacter sp.]|uniref:single-stranded-DNA-specific exonuclease RecJ n=1 Tax=uncultured Campylobacter sp. TaxID=218934 RepID=UPI00262318A8|nr:single-stranded-DNA-specific exonuclease RecJ [uncultured Campylobacter sp.]
MNILNKEGVKKILSSRFENDIHKRLCDLPLPSCLKDIYKAANRIKKAIENNEKVAIVGDYDVDGVISCVILSEFFDDIGFDYIVKIPNRFKNGYGINEDIVKDLDVSLIITVDNGIAAVGAAEVCLENGIDLIITDHHCPPAVLPKAYAIINPKQDDCHFPDVEICGAEVAWYLLGALKEVCKLKYDMCKFLDLLAIAIIADMMELRDLNRVIVKKGIELINSSKREAFKVLKSHYQKNKFELENISFLIAPLLNSTGRMDDAKLSYDFLRAKDKEEAKALLNKIENFNELRKEEENKLFNEALEQIKNEEKAVIVSSDNWHEGVLGIVASRLAKHCSKISFVFSQNEDKLKGSARSIGHVDILELIKKTSHLLQNYGGHKSAAGLCISKSNYEAFKELINAECSKIPSCEFVNSDDILGELKLCDVDFEMIKILEYFEPFGNKNPKPFFAFKDLCVKHKKNMGENNQHLKLILQKENKTVEALYFNCEDEISLNSNISFIASISKNEFRGLLTPQLIIRQLCQA